MVLLYTAAIFLAAFLLFLVQPLAARLVLPHLGGSPAVWTGAMMFFQILLLAGYAFAHALGRRSLRVQGGAQLVAVVACTAFLPLALPVWWGAGANPESSPLVLLLVGLAATVGLPFLVVSSASPLLQSWFARSGHPRAHDPYFLYAASNAGSLLGLTAYPLVVEPLLGLRGQGWVWAGGFTAYAAALGGCWFVAAQRSRGERTDEGRPDQPRPAPPPSTGSPPPRAAPGSRWSQRAAWIGLAAAPSSLSLGVTQFVTTDVAAVPLLWVIPLGVYLLTFIAAFSRRGAAMERVGRVLLPVAAVGATAAVMGRINHPLLLVGAVHMLTLLSAGLSCHGRLAALRPEAARLTEYFLLMSLGGALGGAFNAVVAPMVFDAVLEYPIALAACCGLLLLRPRATPAVAREPALRRRPSPLIMTTLGAAGAVVLMSGYLLAAEAALGWMGIDEPTWVRVVTVGVPCVLTLASSIRPAVMAALVAMLAGQATLYPITVTSVPVRIEHMERSFFGVHLIVMRPSLEVGPDAPPVPPLRMLRHGTTVHGQQWFDRDRRFEPLSYYSRQGPVGDMMRRLEDRIGAVGVVGLGAGTIAAYGRPGRAIDFFEIDPTVARIAQDRTAFTYLDDSASSVRVVVGDGRIALARQPEASYDLIVLDAFSSDAIPVHLLTVEAARLYTSRLRPGGVLLVHISNRHFDLLNPVAQMGRAVGMSGFHRVHAVDGRTEQIAGISGSHWVALSADHASLAIIGDTPGWLALPGAPDRPAWSDDHANALESLRL